MGSSVNQNSTNVKLNTNNYTVSGGNVIQTQDKSVNANEANINSEEIETELLDLSNTIEKTTDDLALEVWRGDWGVGEERKNRLTEAGYDYYIIQERVNQLVWGITDAEYNNDPRLITEEENTIETSEETEEILTEDEQMIQFFESMGLNVNNPEELKESFAKTIDDLSKQKEEMENYLKVDKSSLKDVKEKYPALKFDGDKILSAEEAVSYEGYSDAEMAAAAAVTAIKGNGSTIEEYNRQLSEFLLETYNITFEDYQERLQELNSNIEIFRSSYYQLEQQAKLKPYEEIKETSEYKDYISSIQNLDEEFEKAFLGTLEVNINALGAGDGSNKSHNQAQYAWCSKNYSVLEDEEKEMMLYLLHTGGIQECGGYQTALEDYINQRQGALEAQKVIESITDEDGNINKIKAYELVESGFFDGMNTTFNSLKDAFRDDAIISATEYKQGIIYEYLQTNEEEGMERIYKGFSSIGGMAPVFIVSAVNQGAGIALLATSTYGSSKNYALRQGHTSTESTVYAAMNSATMVGMTVLFANIPNVSVISSDTVQGYAQAALGAATNTYMNAGLKSLALGETIDMESLGEQAKEEMVMAIMTAGFYNKVHNVVNMAKFTFENGKSLTFDSPTKISRYFKENPQQIAELKSLEMLEGSTTPKALPPKSTEANTAKSQSTSSQHIPFSEKGINRVTVEEMAKGPKNGSVVTNNTTTTKSVAKPTTDSSAKNSSTSSQHIPFSEKGINRVTVEEMAKGPKNGSVVTNKTTTETTSKTSTNAFDNMTQKPLKPEPKQNIENGRGNTNEAGSMYKSQGSQTSTTTESVAKGATGATAKVIEKSSETGKTSTNAFDNMTQKPLKPEPKQNIENGRGNTNEPGSMYKSQGSQASTTTESVAKGATGATAKVIENSAETGKTSQNAFDNMTQKPLKPEPKQNIENGRGNTNESGSMYKSQGTQTSTTTESVAKGATGATAKVIENSAETKTSTNAFDNMTQKLLKPEPKQNIENGRGNTNEAGSMYKSQGTQTSTTTESVAKGATGAAAKVIENNTEATSKTSSSVYDKIENTQKNSEQVKSTIENISAEKAIEELNKMGSTKSGISKETAEYLKENEISGDIHPEVAEILKNYEIKDVELAEFMANKNVSNPELAQIMLEKNCSLEVAETLQNYQINDVELAEFMLVKEVSDPTVAEIMLENNCSKFTAEIILDTGADVTTAKIMEETGVNKPVAEIMKEYGVREQIAKIMEGENISEPEIAKIIYEEDVSPRVAKIMYNEGITNPKVAKLMVSEGISKEQAIAFYDRYGYY